MPPPPGELGDPVEPGDKARFTPVDPPVENCSGSCGNGGAIWGSSCMGGRLADGPVEGVSGVKGAGPLFMTPLLADVLVPPCPDDEPELEPEPELGSDARAGNVVTDPECTGLAPWLAPPRASAGAAPAQSERPKVNAIVVCLA